MSHSLLSRLFATFRPENRDRRLNEEIEEHLQELAARQSAQGLDPNDAKFAARREFGPVEPVKELYRDRARFRALENAFRDCRFAIRQSRKNPGFTAAAVLSLALGIGANTALFSFVNSILLRRLPVPAADRLAILKTAGKELRLSYNELNELDRQATEVDGLSGSFPLDVSASLGDLPQWISAELVTGEYFRTLQVRPERGRLLTQKDLDDAAGNPVCVISYRLWQSQFRGAPDIIGRSIRLNTRPYKIIGVTERSFTGPDLQRPADLQIPATRLIDYMPAFVGLPAFRLEVTAVSFFDHGAAFAPCIARERSGATEPFEPGLSEHR